MEKKPFNKIAYNNTFILRAYDRINLTVPKGDKEIIKAYAESKGKSVNAYINDLIAADLEKNSGE